MLVSPKASLTVSKHHLGSVDPKGLQLHYGSLVFKHLLLWANVGQYSGPSRMPGILA